MNMSLAFVLLLSAAANAITVTNSSIASTTRQTSTFSVPNLTAAPTESGTPCCYIWPKFVGLGEWYTSSVTATVATVITQYIQYNNTVVTTSTTVYNETATQTQALGLQFLLQNNKYGFVTAMNATSTVIGGTTLVSPTPFWEFFDIEVGTGIETINTYTTGVETFCGSSSAGDDLDASFIYFPTSAAFYTRVERVTVGQDFVGTLVDELAESGTTIPGLEDCTIRNGDGEPRVHVAVTALTDHSSTTLRRDGNFPTSAAPVTTRPAEVTPAPQPPPPAPETTQQPAPVDPPLPTPALPANPNPAPPNSEVGPGPSNGNPGPSNGNPGPSNGNPGPSNGNPGPSNGNPGPSNGNPGPSNGGPAPVRPTNQPAPVVAPSLTIGTTVVPVTAIGTNNGGVVIGGSTLLPSSVVTFQDNTISLGPSGTNLVIVGPAGPSTVPLFVPAPGAAPAVTGNPQPADSIVIGTQTIPLSLPSNTGQGVILPGGTTLAPGSVVTFQGQTLSLAPGGSSIVVAASGSQSTIALYTPAATNAAQETVLSVGSSPYTIAYVTASEGGVVLPGGQTLLPGSTTVVDGTTLSLGPQGTELVVGTSTVPLQPAQTTDADTSTTSSGTGGNGPSPTSTPEEFTAGAGRNVDGWRSGAGFAAAVVAILQVVL